MSETTSPVCRMRPMERADLATVLEWRNHPQVRRHMFTQHVIGAEEHASWFARNSQDESKRLLIFECDGEPLGFASLGRVGAGNVWDWGCYVSPTARKGTGRRLGHATLRLAFVDMGIHKLCAQVLAENERSIGFHRTLGFAQEGVLREQHFDGTSYHDVICFGLLRPAWHTEVQ